MVTSECLMRIAARWRHDFNMSSFANPKDVEAIYTMLADCRHCCETDAQVEGAYGSYRITQAGSRYRPKWIDFVAIMREQQRERRRRADAEEQDRKRAEWRDSPDKRASDLEYHMRARRWIERLQRKMHPEVKCERTDRGRGAVGVGRNGEEGTDPRGEILAEGIRRTSTPGAGADVGEQPAATEEQGTVGKERAAEVEDETGEPDDLGQVLDVPEDEVPF